MPLTFTKGVIVPAQTYIGTSTTPYNGRKIKEGRVVKLILIENCKSIIFAVYKTLFLIHIAACIWIYIKYYEKNVDESFIEAERLMKD